MKGIHAVVLDLEGTLFRSKALAEMHYANILKLISKKKRIDVFTADRVFKDARSKLTLGLGYRPTTNLVVGTLGISKGEFHNVLDDTDPTIFIRPSPDLRRTLGSIKKKYQLALLTNVSHITTRKILDALDLPSSLFHFQLTGTELKKLKPSLEPFIQVSLILEEEPENIIMVGDRIHIDLKPAKSLGMMTVLISRETTCSPYVDIRLQDIRDLNKVL